MNVSEIRVRRAVSSAFVEHVRTASWWDFSKKKKTKSAHAGDKHCRSCECLLGDNKEEQRRPFLCVCKCQFYCLVLFDFFDYDYFLLISVLLFSFCLCYPLFFLFNAHFISDSFFFFPFLLDNLILYHSKLFFTFISQIKLNKNKFESKTQQGLDNFHVKFIKLVRQVRFVLWVQHL